MIYVTSVDVDVSWRRAKMKDKVLKEFFELKAQQMIYTIYLRKNHKIAYTSCETDIMFKNIDIQTKYEAVVEKIIDLTSNEENQKILRAVDLQEEAKNYKVSAERQKELTGFTIDELIV